MLKFQYFGRLMWRADSLEKTLMLEGLGAGGEGDDRGWDGWMASLTRWAWVWVNSGSWWWTVKPGVLQSELKDNCFTEFCSFLQNFNMNQSQVYIYPLPFEPSTHLSLHPTPLGWYRALFEFPETHRKFPLAIYFTHGNVSFHVTLSIQLTLNQLFWSLYWFQHHADLQKMYVKSNMETYITICKIDRQRKFAVWLRKLKQGLCINLEGWDGREMGGSFKWEGIYVYLWLNHVEVWQKTAKFCKAIILQLKKIN